MLPLLPLILGGAALVSIATVLGSDDSNSNDSNYDEAERVRKEHEEKQKRREAYIEEFKMQMKEKYDGKVSVRDLNPSTLHISCILDRKLIIKSVNSTQCTSLEQSIKNKKQERETFQALLDKLNALYFGYAKAQVPTQVNANLPIKESSKHRARGRL